MKRFVIVAALLATLCATGFAAWRFLPLGQTYFTDASTIKEPAATAQVRDVLWEPPAPLTEPINAAGETYEPRLSNDGTTLYFVRGKAGNNADIFLTRRTPQGWSEPQPIAEINSPIDDMGPEFSVDGESLYFYSNRAGGLGGYDLWVSRRGADGTWREPTNLGPQVNSQFNDYGPALTSDARTLYFSSNRPQPGDQPEPDPSAWPATLREEIYTRTYDLFSVVLTDSGAGSAQPLTALNTPHNEGAPAVSSFGDFLYFASDRPGGSGGFDLYRSRRLHNELQPPMNLGGAVNTTFHELDPALSMNGFGLDFSSNRSQTGQPIQATREYKLYHTNSREVFSETEHFDRAPIDWAALWRAVGPNLLWALLALALLLVMLLLFKGGQNRKLSLLTKCVLASLAAHLLLMLLFNVWEVAATVAGEIRSGGRGGGIRVALSPSSGGGITAQIGGSLSEITVPNAHLDSIQAPAVVESPLPLSQINVPLEKAALEIQLSRAVEMRAQEATTPSIPPVLPDLAPQVDASRPHSVALNVPSVHSATPTTEAVIQIGAAQTSIARQQSTLPESAGNSTIAPPSAPIRTQLPVSTSLTRGGFANSARDAATTISGAQNESINMPVPASVSAYRVTLASHLPEAPISGAAAQESTSSLPAIGIGGSTRQVVVDRIDGTPIGNQADGVLGLAPADLTGLGKARFVPRPLMAAKDAELPGGIGASESGYPGVGLAGTDQIFAIPSEGNSFKGYASLTLALPGAGHSVSSSDSEKGGSDPVRVGFPSATRAPLSNELAGSQAATSGTFGTSESSLPRADVFAASGPGGLGSPNGTKSATTLASITRDATPEGLKAEGGPLATSMPATAVGFFELNLPTDLSLPENPYPQRPAEGRLDNDSPGQEEIVGAIRGTVTNKATRAPLRLAQVRLVLSDRETLTATTDSAGKYTLDVPATPDFFALSASLDQFVPQTRSIERARLEAKKKLVVNFALEPQSQNALATEAAPDVHHLGDDRFSGDINSQFQKKSEGAKFSIGFEIAPEILANPLQRAEVRLMAKGVQRRHKLFINRTLLERRLDEAPEDGGFGEFIAPFDPALLVAGVNSLRIEALPSDSDIDDFEFVNICIYLVPPAGPGLGEGTSLETDARTTGTQ